MRSHRVAVVPALALAFVVGIAGSSARTAVAGEIPFDAVFDGIRLAKLAGLEWSPDGATIAGLWKENGKTLLVAFDGATGAELWRQDLAALRERDAEASSTGASERASSSSPSMESFVFSTKDRNFLLKGEGDLFLWTPGEEEVRRLTSSKDAEEEAPAFSPDGTKVAFVRSNDLWVLELATGTETRLTSDGSANEILNGKTDWVYWEEIWNRDSTGFWWSPDSRALAFYRFDERAVPTYPLLDETGVGVEVEWQRYPKPGEPNPIVRVGVVELESRAVQLLDTGDPASTYLARVHWRADGRQLAVERLDREQTRLDLLFCEPTTGACRTVAGQSSATWVNLADDFRFLADGGFLWSDEGSGWRDLARYDRLGRERADLLPEEWMLGGVEAVREVAGEVIVTARRRAMLGAASQQVLSLPVSGKGDVRVLADGGGIDGAQVSEATGAWIHTRSDATHPPVRTLRRADGAVAAALPGATDVAGELLALPAWEIFDLPAASGARLPARIVKPSGFDPARRYPVLMYHYGGPASQVVANNWGGPRDLWHRWMASRGYVVLMVDNEASTYFGKAGEDRLHRRFGELELAGQLAAVEWLKGQAWADAERIGIWGWSGGGSNTLYAVLHSPGTWRAAVAGAPVTDFRLYDSIWTERYLDTPESNPDGYRDSSPIEAAAALADALLVVHGTGDDNVHPQNTIALIDRLVDAERTFESAFYPNEKHGFAPGASRHFYARMTEFFDRHLRPVSAPAAAESTREP